MTIERAFNPLPLLDKYSVFWLGPRGTGKSFLLRKNTDAQYLDLLKAVTYLELQANPSALEAMITSDKVIIDEIQRIPDLLNEVHRLIEEKRIRFLLTGSSARKLKQDGVNLLAGRARRYSFLPLTWFELRNAGLFDLNRFLTFGGLPTVWNKDVEAAPYLFSYVDTYLKEEIERESRIRKLPSFARFLKFSAIHHGHVLNYTKIANDAQVAPHTVREYYHLLEDTLVGFTLGPWNQSRKRKAIQTAKFYYFDLGVVHALMNLTSLDRHSDLYGTAFEHMVIAEVRAYLAYHSLHHEMGFWRTKHGDEVDLTIGNQIAIEIKASDRVSPRDHKTLARLAEEGVFSTYYLVSQDPTPRSFERNILHLHYTAFFEHLWSGKIVS